MRRRKGRDPYKLRGAARMLQFGYKPVQVWLDASEALTFRAGALQVGLRLATFLRLATRAWWIEHGKTARHGDLK